MVWPGWILVALRGFIQFNLLHTQFHLARHCHCLLLSCFHFARTLFCSIALTLPLYCCVCNCTLVSLACDRVHLYLYYYKLWNLAHYIPRPLSEGGTAGVYTLSKFNDVGKFYSCVDLQV